VQGAASDGCGEFLNAGRVYHMSIKKAAVAVSKSVKTTTT